MENEKLDLQVGDRVTYKSAEEPDEEAREYIIKDEHQLADIIGYAINNKIEILKIERPHYEVVEEKKELLTEEEREFLKAIIKFYGITRIEFTKSGIAFYDNCMLQLYPKNPKNLKFKGIEENKQYALKELGLEEQ